MSEAGVSNPVLTMADRAAQRRQRFADDGQSISGWARDNGFSIKLTHQVLSGARPCRFGDSHRIAVALGIKSCPAASHG